MTTSGNIIELQFGSIGETVTQQHFGANYLAHLENATFDGVEGSFFSAAAALGIDDFRYPGGTIAEEFFDITDENHFVPNNGSALECPSLLGNGETNSMVNLYDFLQNVQSSDGSATIVIPTIVFAEAINSNDPSAIGEVENQIKEFIQNCLEMPNGNLIGAFEIGNEYPAFLDLDGAPDAALSSPVDFAKIMVNFSVWIDEVFQDLGLEQPPEILVQTPFVQYGGKGVVQYINHIMSLESEGSGVESLESAFAAIDGFIIHSYVTEIYSGDYDALDLDFQIVDRMSDAFGAYLAQLGLPAKDYSINITEWNIRNKYVSQLDLGKTDLAISMLDQFHQLVSLGADTMHVWPILHNTHNSLSEIGEDGEVSLHHAGELFSSLQEHVVGMNVVESDTYISIDSDEDPELLFHAFQSETGAVVYVTNISDTFVEAAFDLSELNIGNMSYEVTYFSDAESPGSVEVSDTFVEVDIDSATIMQITFSAAPILIECFRGGYTNQDGLYSGSDSADFLKGGGGDDTIRGFEGDDLLVGKAGDDTLYGNQGNDTLIGDAGDDVIHSGQGRDEIVFREDWGNDLVSDFNAGANSDILDFSQVSEIVSFEDLLSNHLTSDDAGTTIDDGLGNSVFLVGIGVEDLEAEHFLF